MQNRFEKALESIDKLNSEDPRRLTFDGTEKASEVLYSHRMRDVLQRMIPDASENLKIAVYAQHIGRWKIPRTNYPGGRSGYLKWKTELLQFHAEETQKILKECGYDEEAIGRVGSIIRKLAMNRDAESQALEDTACLVFIQYYLEDFMKKHPGEKIQEIIAKTWKRMSDKGKQFALNLKMPENVRSTIEAALKA